jgi:hypothetical protein
LEEGLKILVSAVQSRPSPPLFSRLLAPEHRRRVEQLLIESEFALCARQSAKTVDSARMLK